MLLVPSPCPIHRQARSPVLIASSLRQTPPPAEPSQSRHGPSSVHAGEIASAATRPEKFCVATVGSWTVVSGPRLAHAGPCATLDPRYAIPRNTQYLDADARRTAAVPGIPGYACW